jgi:hypothetical protein
MESIQFLDDAAAPWGQGEIAAAAVVDGGVDRGVAVVAELPEDAAEIARVQLRTPLQPDGRAGMPGFPQHLEHAHLGNRELLNPRGAMLGLDAAHVEAVEPANPVGARCRDALPRSEIH